MKNFELEVVVESNESCLFSLLSSKFCTSGDRDVSLPPATGIEPSHRRLLSCFQGDKGASCPSYSSCFLNALIQDNQNAISGIFEVAYPETHQSNIF